MEGVRSSIGRGGGGGENGGSAPMIPGAAKKIFPVDSAEEALHRRKLGVDAEEVVTSSGVVVGVLGGGGGGAVDSDSSSSCGGGNLVRTLRLKPTSTSSTSSSQLSLLRHPADETPPRHLLD